MYKVYFAVYLSLQKCGDFKNIRHFFCDFICVIQRFSVFCNEKVKLLNRLSNFTQCVE